MQLSILITFEIIAFFFLALGLIPFQRSNDGSLPLVNKGVFILVASILFFTLALTAVSYNVVDCSTVLETEINANVTQYESSCELVSFSDEGLSYLNMGMGILSLMVGVIIIILASLTKNDYKMNED